MILEGHKGYLFMKFPVFDELFLCPPPPSLPRGDFSNTMYVMYDRYDPSRYLPAVL